MATGGPRSSLALFNAGLLDESRSRGAALREAINRFQEPPRYRAGTLWWSPQSALVNGTHRAVCSARQSRRLNIAGGFGRCSDAGVSFGGRLCIGAHVTGMVWVDPAKHRYRAGWLLFSGGDWARAASIWRLDGGSAARIE